MENDIVADVVVEEYNIKFAQTTFLLIISVSLEIINNKVDPKISF